MPRYYFDRIDGVFDADPEGLELKDLDEARGEAVNFAADTLKNLSGSLWNGEKIRIEVKDSAKELLFTISISAENAFEAGGKA